MERLCDGPLSLPAQPLWFSLRPDAWEQVRRRYHTFIALGQALVLMLNPSPVPPDHLLEPTNPLPPPHRSFRSLLTCLLSCWHIDHSLLLKTLSFSAAVTLPSPPSSAQVPLPMLPLLLFRPLGTPSTLLLTLLLHPFWHHMPSICQRI